LVGNASAFSAQLGRIGFGTFETVELPDLDLTAANFKRTRVRAEAGGAGRAGRVPAASSHQPSAVAYRQTPAARQAPPIAAEQGIKAMELLDRAIAAKGGLEKLRAIKTIVAK